MDCASIVDERYDRLVQLSELEMEKCDFIDKAIFEIICVRCSMEMGGNLDPLYQYFKSKSHLDFFIFILEEIDENPLAEQFQKIRSLLPKNDFWIERELDLQDENTMKIEAIMEEIDKSQVLWDLDGKLGQLFIDFRSKKI